MMADAYPLHWPAGWPRTPTDRREDGKHKFKRGDWKGGYKFLSLHEASSLMLDELRLLGATHAVISSNVALRLDGLPRSGQRTPEDPGVAVFFALGGNPKAMARDAYTRVEDNLRSLTLAIQGMRQMERHGGGLMLERAFSGFAALPSPDSITEAPNSAWWVVLCVGPSAGRDEISAAYKARVREVGGASVELNAAKEAGMAAARGKDAE